MLVLTRYRDEVIRIGDDVKIRVVDVRDGRVRIGVEAPPEVAVWREELYEVMRRKERGGRRQEAGGRVQEKMAAKPRPFLLTTDS